MTVTGTIKPSITCEPTVTNKEIRDTDIDASKLDKTKATVLTEAKSTDLAVNCSDAAKFSIKFSDAQNSTAVNDPSFFTQISGKLNGAKAENAFGLGDYTADNKKKNIGAFFLKVDQASITSTGNAKHTLLVGPGNAAWNKDTAAFLQKSDANGMVYGIAPAGGSAPVALKTLKMPITISTAIDSKDMDVRNEINLNGKFTIDIFQL